MFTLLLVLLFLGLTFVVIQLFSTSERLPFMHSIFFFGLVNFNIIILLLLLFLIFRNVVKIFAERRGGWFGQTLKAKLIAAFLVFSTVPTTLMFLIVVVYINGSFDKWFSPKVSHVLKNAMATHHEYYWSEKKRNYHFADQISRRLHSEMSQKEVQRALGTALKEYALHSVEYYPSLLGSRVIAMAEDETLPPIPPVSTEFLQKGLVRTAEASTIHQFGEGNLVRVIMPLSEDQGGGAVVVSTFVPLSLVREMDNITASYEEFRNINPLEYPLKSIYIIILVLITLVILFAGTWFGFHLAKQVSNSLEALGIATRRVSQGDYQKVAVSTGSQEIHELVDNFNRMVENLGRSKREVLQANRDLQQTLERLDEHNHYVQMVLGNVSTGVISVDNSERVATMNLRAAQLLGVDGNSSIGRKLKEILGGHYDDLFGDIFEQMKRKRQVRLQKTVRVEIGGAGIPLQVTLSFMLDEKNERQGTLLVFDDLTMVVNAQRAAAWTEVARRIAHEIKNPLTPIKLSAQRLQKKFGERIQDPAFEECTRMIIRQTDDLKRLVNEFNNFARLPQANPRLSHLNKSIEEALVLYRSAHASEIFEVWLDESLPEFKFDPEQIQRVIVNLLENAIAATSETQEPRIQIRTQYDSLLKIVRLAVIDNGPGIPEEIRDHIFDPYYSTKKEGTGLGLAIVKRIVEDHNGFVRAVENKPQGLKMIVELPVIEKDLVISDGESGLSSDQTVDPSNEEARHG